MNKDEYFMRLALKEAQRSYKETEVPIGAVITLNNEVIATGRNQRETKKNALWHAEIEAINKACTALGGWRLNQCAIYVTLEPCPMCTGAIINSRIARLVFGAYDQKAGSCGSVINLFDLPYNHKPEVLGGILNDECSTLLSDFFKELRKHK